MSETPIQKQLRIRLGVVQRTKKELDEYHVEFETQRTKIDKMRADAKDEYDIKKQVEVLSETEMMIPDTMRRLSKGIEELKDFLAVNGEDASLAATENLEKAKQLLAELSPEDASGTNGDDDRI